MKHPLVTVNWLFEHLHDEHLVILESQLDPVQNSIDANNQEIEIVGTRIFDIKNNFSDTNNPLPNTFPSETKFTTECQKIGIHSNSCIVIYDRIGTYSSPRAWFMFKAMGHANVFVLNGGLPEWIKEGYPIVVRQEKNIPLGNFEAKFNPHFIKNKEQVLENILEKKALLLDARSEDRFNGTHQEPRAGLRSGHIPGSINIPFDVLQQEGKYKSKTELEAILKLGNQPLWFTCGSGITACIVLLACELISDNPKAVYDGSWTEWGSSNLPIE